MGGKNRSPSLPAVGCDVTHSQHTTTDTQSAMQLPTPRSRRQWRQYWQHVSAAEDQVRQVAYNASGPPAPAAAARLEAEPAQPLPAYVPFLTPAFLAAYSPEIQEWLLQLDHEDHVQILLAQ